MLFDLPHVSADAGPLLVSGDFSSQFLKAVTLTFMKWIIHDRDNERSVMILRNCRRAMVEGGRLLLVEMVVQPGNGPDLSKFPALNMMDHEENRCGGLRRI